MCKSIPFAREYDSRSFTARDHSSQGASQIAAVQSNSWDATEPPRLTRATASSMISSGWGTFTSTKRAVATSKADRGSPVARPSPWISMSRMNAPVDALLPQLVPGEILEWTEPVTERVGRRDVEQVVGHRTIRAELATATSAFATQRAGMATVLVLLAVGGFLLLRVREPRR